MIARLVCVLCLVAPLLAAPTNTNAGQQGQQGPPKECEKPFGDGKLATGPNPYNFTVMAKQRSDITKYKETFKGAPVDMIITFTAPPGTGAVKAFAMRCGLPFPVVQWINTGDAQQKIVSCIAPQSLDTMVAKGSIGQRFSVAATPLLAAWANHDTIPVIYEMAIQGADGQIYVAAYNGTIKVKETDYKLPAKFFQPPPHAQNQQQMQDPRFGPQNGQGQDPRFGQQGQMTRLQQMQLQQQQQQQFGGQDQQFGQRKKREAFAVEDSKLDEELGFRLKRNSKKEEEAAEDGEEESKPAGKKKSSPKKSLKEELEEAVLTFHSHKHKKCTCGDSSDSDSSSSEEEKHKKKGSHGHGHGDRKKKEDDEEEPEGKHSNKKKPAANEDDEEESGKSAGKKDHHKKGDKHSAKQDGGEGDKGKSEAGAAEGGNEEGGEQEPGHGKKGQGEENSKDGKSGSGKKGSKKEKDGKKGKDGAKNAAEEEKAAAKGGNRTAAVSSQNSLSPVNGSIVFANVTSQIITTLTNLTEVITTSPPVLSWNAFTASATTLLSTTLAPASSTTSGAPIVLKNITTEFNSSSNSSALSAL